MLADFSLTPTPLAGKGGMNGDHFRIVGG
jgi:hypothetical protein